MNENIGPQAFICAIANFCCGWLSSQGCSIRDTRPSIDLPTASEFSRIITRNMLDFAQEDAELAGDAAAVVQLQALKDAKVDAIRVNAPHLDPAVANELQRLLGSQAPVVHNLYLQKRLLEQVQGKGPYTVHGVDDASTAKG